MSVCPCWCVCVLFLFVLMCMSGVDIYFLNKKNVIQVISSKHRRLLLQQQQQLLQQHASSPSSSAASTGDDEWSAGYNNNNSNSNMDDDERYIVLEGLYIEDHHANFEYDAQSDFFTLCPAHPSARVFVNGRRVSYSTAAGQKQVLLHNDRIIFGANLVFRVHLPTSSSSAAAAASSSSSSCSASCVSGMSEMETAETAAAVAAMNKYDWSYAMNERRLATMVAANKNGEKEKEKERNAHSRRHSRESSWFEADIFNALASSSAVSALHSPSRPSSSTSSISSSNSAFLSSLFDSDRLAVERVELEERLRVLEIESKKQLENYLAQQEQEKQKLKFALEAAQAEVNTQTF